MIGNYKTTSDWDYILSKSDATEANDTLQSLKSAEFHSELLPVTSEAPQRTMAPVQEEDYGDSTFDVIKVRQGAAKIDIIIVPDDEVYIRVYAMRLLGDIYKDQPDVVEAFMATLRGHPLAWDCFNAAVEEALQRTADDL